jgi:starvation-inducible DNA-binding protein
MEIDPPPEVSSKSVTRISLELKLLLADVFAIYFKTKNFYWHIRGPHFRDYQLLLNGQADELFAMADQIAERARKLGGATLRSIGDIARRQRIKDNDKEQVPAELMLAELLADNQSLTAYLRSTHVMCKEFHDVATSSLIENWIDQAERRTWFLAETIETE